MTKHTMEFEITNGMSDGEVDHVRRTFASWIRAAVDHVKRFLDDAGRNGDERVLVFHEQMINCEDCESVSVYRHFDEVAARLISEIETLVVNCSAKNSEFPCSTVAVHVNNAEKEDYELGITKLLDVRVYRPGAWSDGMFSVFDAEASIEEAR